MRLFSLCLVYAHTPKRPLHSTVWRARTHTTISNQAEDRETQGWAQRRFYTVCLSCNNLQSPTNSNFNHFAQPPTTANHTHTNALTHLLLFRLQVLLL